MRYWRAAIAKRRWFDAEREHIFVFLLSARYDLLGYQLVAIGSLNETIAHPREIFRAAVAAGAYAIIIAHNHPSGDPQPSQSDIELTKTLWTCGELLRIKMLDHIVIGRNGRRYCSIREVRPKAFR